MNWVWLNGRMVRERDATIGIWEPGCRNGEGLFETVGVHHGAPFRLAQHLRRFRQGAGALGWSQLPASKMLAAGARRTLAKNRCLEGALRIVAVATSRGLLTSMQAGLSPYPASWRTRGVSAVTIGPHPSFGPLGVVKSTSYVAYRVALQRAQRRRAHEGLFHDGRGNVTEGTRSTVFLIDGRGRLLTPPLETGILSGVTRSTVIEVARSLGTRVEERRVALSRFTTAREAFLTSALLGVMPLVKVDGRPVGNGKPGPVTQELMHAYGRLVAHECRPSRR